MYTIDTAYAYCDRISHVAWSVCLCVLVTLMHCAKTAEPIEMPFGWVTRWAQGTMVSRSPSGKGQFSGLSGLLKNIGIFCCRVSSKINISCGRVQEFADW